MVDQLLERLVGEPAQGSVDRAMAGEGHKIDIAIHNQAWETARLIPAATVEERAIAFEEALRQVCSTVATSSLRIFLTAAAEAWKDPTNQRLTLPDFLAQVTRLSQAELRRHFGKNIVDINSSKE